MALPRGESQSPNAAAGGEGDVEVRTDSAISVAASMPVRPPPTTTTVRPASSAGQPLAQPEGSGAAGDLVGVLGDAGDAVVVAPLPRA